MRINSGRLRGRQIPAPPGTQTRPTTDVIKEAMFSVVEEHMQLSGAIVLDLFAGTGQLSWEALSRGAHAATLVDASTDVCRHLRSVAIEFGVSDQVTIVRSDALQYLRHAQVKPPNLTFVDPPYHLRCCNAVVTQLVEHQQLPPSAIVVVEHGDQEVLLPLEGCRALWHKERSTTVVDILVHEAMQP